MQIKAGLKKEWFQFTRTFRLGGILLAILSLAVADPLILGGVRLLGEMLINSDIPASIAASADYGINLDELLGGSMAGLFYSSAMADLCSTSMLIIMLVLMSPCGGEQKKRATIIPSCTGLGTFEYLLPKYLIYPAAVFVTAFAGCCISGVISNLLCDDSISAGIILLEALMCSVYMVFELVIYMSIGLCTNRPGIVTVFMYVGFSVVEMILEGLGLTDYHPFTLRALVCGGMLDEDFVLADNAASIAVGIVLSIVISVLMFILTLTVQKCGRINNQEDKPEF